MQPNTPFMAWPGWPQMRRALVLSLLVSVWFGFVYGGCNWITAHRTLRVPVFMQWELGIPFWPGAAFWYMSIYLLFVMAPFVLRRRHEFDATASALAFSIAVGGIGFLLLPSEPGYPPIPEITGIWAGWFHVADEINLQYNMAPSLHVALSVCSVAAFAPHAGRVTRALLWAWAGAIAASTLLAHQHHLLDVVTGWALGWASCVWFRHRFAKSHQGLDTAANLPVGTLPNLPAEDTPAIAR